MNAQSTAFAYDDFEQYLLDASKIDQAPSDLPARLGVALGLGVPILAAAEAASLLPTTSAAFGTGVADVGYAAVTPTGLFASLKTSLGIGASTLWSTAAKGIAVGLLAGTAIVGTSQAVAKITAHWLPKTHVAASMTTANRSNSDGVGAKPAAAVTPPAASGPASEDSVAIGAIAGDDMDEPVTSDAKHRVVVSGEFDRGGTAEDAPDISTDKPRKRLPHPIFPEKTTAIARYPLLFDDVSALYDAPKRVAPAPAVAVVNPEPMIDPAELAAMRTKTIQRSRTLLGQSKAELALSELDAFRKRVSDRNFGVDELLLRIEALAMLGRAKEAQADVANVERLAPNSAALRQAQQLARSRFVR
jgi:hypothetical protein